MRTLRRRKESYVGPWLPEPLLTTPDVAEDVELADTASMAHVTAPNCHRRRVAGISRCVK